MTIQFRLVKIDSDTKWQDSTKATLEQDIIDAFNGFGLMRKYLSRVLLRERVGAAPITINLPNENLAETIKQAKENFSD